MASEKDDVGNGNTAAPESPKPKPTEKQINLLAIIMQNIEEQPKINWEAVASQASLKNDRVAKEMYRQMCKKFGWNKTGGQPTNPGLTCGTPSKVTKNTGRVGSAKKARGKKAAAAAEQEDDNPKVKDEDPFMSGALQDDGSI
ncbi:hypothetical protein VM1G_09270 [Cytospora mali]|uniref:Uncharacterized protein n=1 Tax=Cytospora mali TaxID=578113 RepID=A0A194WB59_CYTMA|nr:hypothetical protein VM1G_09270 [Valsa mali]